MSAFPERTPMTVEEYLRLDQVHITSLGLSFPVEAVYEDIVFSNDDNPLD